MKLLFIIRLVESNIVGTPYHIFIMVATAISRGFLPWEFAMAIYRGKLRQLFTIAICRESLPWLFAVGLFWYVSKPFFLCEQILFLCKQIFFN